MSAIAPVPAVPDAGVSAAAGPGGSTPPLLAEAWLLAWSNIGGSVTIGTDGSLHPWFSVEDGCADDDCATVLLAELIDTPGLPVAIRIILGGTVRRKRRKAA